MCASSLKVGPNPPNMRERPLSTLNSGKKYELYKSQERRKVVVRVRVPPGALKFLKFSLFFDLFY